MNFDALVARHPEIVCDRHQLSFGRTHDALTIADRLRQKGAVSLKEVLEPRLLADCYLSFSDFMRTLGCSRSWLSILDRDDPPSPEWTHGEISSGSWHCPWVVRLRRKVPAASIILAVIGSWAWPIVEELCGSADVAILLRLCQARHAIDIDLGVGGHQDARVLPAEAPFAMWVPLQTVVPRRHAGLGFVVDPPDDLLPVLPHNDVGQSYVLANLDRVWLPTYVCGDVSIHTNLLPHFTTGFGTGSDRYSLEIRAVARKRAPAELLNPSLFISRLGGVPRIVGAHCKHPVRAQAFFRELRVQSVRRPPHRHLRKSAVEHVGRGGTVAGA